MLDHLKAAAPAVYAKQEQYKRQYAGLIIDGKKILHVNCFCRNGGADWTEREIDVCDGGDCYFNIKVDLPSRKCFDLYINGES